MIKSLRLINYRSHRDTRLIFHRGINAIIGDGMSGKSNILRALKFLLYQRPISPKHIRHGEKQARIILKTKDGIAVELHKGSDSKYLITDKNNSQQFRKFGSTVPPEVNQALRIHTINFQFQLDTPFAVTESASAVTKIINRLTKVDTIDAWIKGVNANIRDYSTVVRHTEKQIEEITSQLEPLKHMEQLDPVMDRLKKLTQEKEKIEHQYWQIHELVGEIKGIEKILTRLTKALNAEKLFHDLQEVEKLGEELDKQQDALIEFIDAKRKMKRLQINYNGLKRKYISAINKARKCPVCFAEIDVVALKRIKDKL